MSTDTVDTTTYRGAYLDKDHGTSWRLTHDDTKLLDKPDDEVLFVTDEFSLLNELLVRYPAPHPKLTFLAEPNTNVDWQTQRPLCTTVRVYNHPLYTGDDTDEFIALLTEHGQLYTRLDLGPEHGVMYKTGEGSVWIGGNYHKLACWDPKKARARIKMLQNRDVNGHVTVPDVNLLDDAIWRMVRPIKAFTADSSDRHTRLYTLQENICLFNCLFGKNAIRRYKPFQAFIALWKRRQKKSDEIFRMKITDEMMQREGSCNFAHRVNAFVDWLNEECKRRPSKPQEEWQRHAAFAPIMKEYWVKPAE